MTDLNSCRATVHYSGRVQGVGFRYAVKSLAPGYDATGTVKNLPDGRVELILEGEREELEAFIEAVHDSGLGPLIRDESCHWSEPSGEWRGCEIVR
jgi:acylphosphatase